MCPEMCPDNLSTSLVLLLPPGFHFLPVSFLSHGSFAVYFTVHIRVIRLELSTSAEFGVYSPFSDHNGRVLRYTTIYFPNPHISGELLTACLFLHAVNLLTCLELQKITNPYISHIQKDYISI